MSSSKVSEETSTGQRKIVNIFFCDGQTRIYAKNVLNILEESADEKAAKQAMLVKGKDGGSKLRGIGIAEEGWSGDAEGSFDDVMEESLTCVGIGNNWARGMYTDGVEWWNGVAQDVLRGQIEALDAFAGVCVTHQSGMSSGSGLASYVANDAVREHWADANLLTVTSLPSPKVSDVVVEPYNSVLTLSTLHKSATMTAVLDNGKLFNLASEVKGAGYVNWPDIHERSSRAMAALMATSWSAGDWLSSAQQQFSAAVRAEGDCAWLAVSNEHHCLSNCQSAKDSDTDGSRAWPKMEARVTADHDDSRLPLEPLHHWHEARSTTCSAAAAHPASLHGSLTLHPTSAVHSFDRVCRQFDRMYKRKAFLHWYMGEGMDEMEFEEARAAVEEIRTSYDASVEAGEGALASWEDVVGSHAIRYRDGLIAWNEESKLDIPKEVLYTVIIILCGHLSFTVIDSLSYD